MNDAVEWLRQMAAALRVFGRNPEDHTVSYALDQAADILGGSQQSKFYPCKTWTDYLEKWRSKFKEPTL